MGLMEAGYGKDSEWKYLGRPGLPKTMGMALNGNIWGGPGWRNVMRMQKMEIFGGTGRRKAIEMALIANSGAELGD